MAMTLSRPSTPRAPGELTQGVPNQIKEAAKRNTSSQITLRDHRSVSTMPQVGHRPHDLRNPRRQVMGIPLSHTGKTGPIGCIGNFRLMLRISGPAPVAPGMERRRNSGVRWIRWLGPLQQHCQRNLPSVPVRLINA